MLGAQDVLPLVHDRPMISTAAHELGHTISWPHSFTGRLYVGMEVNGQEVQAGIEYDDPFDVMGYQRLWGTGNWQHPLTGSFRLKGTQRGYDRTLPRPGVQVHAIDQRGTACQGPFQDSAPAACADEGRRQVPVPNRPDSLASMIRPGGSRHVGGVTISVLRKTSSGRFVVRVRGQRVDLPVVPSAECFLFHYRFNCAPEPTIR